MCSNLSSLPMALEARCKLTFNLYTHQTLDCRGVTRYFIRQESFLELGHFDKHEKERLCREKISGIFAWKLLKISF